MKLKATRSPTTCVGDDCGWLLLECILKVGRGIRKESERQNRTKMKRRKRKREEKRKRKEACREETVKKRNERR